MEQILQVVRALDGVLDLAPAPGSEFPEVAWGDHFFYYAPNEAVPTREQPFATIVTKNYPGDALCDLDDPDRWRLNIHVGARAFTRLTGEDPQSAPTPRDYSATDTVLPHPVYRAQAWVAVTNPGEHTHADVLRLLRAAHTDAMRRTVRRQDTRS